ncbi:hypothetical protein Vafri_2281 [Volvox africanus]|nr:hypothetical protein Vafri_2281 [Volvox africanus]
METLNEQDAMRVLQSAAAFDATRSFGSRTSALGPGRLSVAPHLPQRRQSFSGGSLPSPPQALAEDIWREMAEAECGQQKRHGDLDSWLDVFRATAGSLRNAWCSREILTFESMAFGWLALARKHEPLPCGPPVAAGEEVTDADVLGNWLSEAQWAQAAYQLAAPASFPGGAGAGGVAESAGCEDSSPEQRLVQLLGLQSPADLLACCPQPRGPCPAFFTAVHEESRTIRLVIRGSNSLPDLLNSAIAETSALGPGFAPRGMLEAAQQLLEEEAGRLRAAVEARPGYGLRCIGHSGGAGIAALLVVLVALEGQSGAQRLGAPVGGMRATCFSPPAVVTSELAELHAGCIDSVVYNADLGSRCSSASLRRLANEMSMASREVLSRSELALALRRSGALGLASHVVAAALCRCQPPQEGPSFPTGPAPSLVGMNSRHTLMEGLSSLGNSLTRPPPAMTAAGSHALGGLAATAPHPGLAIQTSLPGGRLCQLATLGPQVGNGRSSGTLQERPVVLTRSLSGGASPRHSAPLLPGASAPPVPSPLGPPMPMPPRPPMPPPAAPPLPAVHSNVTLPPLIAVPSLAGGVGNVTTSGRGVGFDSPRRRMPETHSSSGVLPPPPLVAAAAAAAASVQSQNTAVVSATVGPTPPRRVLTSVSIDLKEPRLNITATGALLTQSDDGSAVATGAGSGSFPAAISPLQLSMLPVPSGTVPLAGALPPPLSVLAVLGPRRDLIPATDGAVAAAAVQGPMATTLAALPPLQLPVLIAGVAPQPHSPRVARHTSHLDVCDLREQSELSPERSLRTIQQLPLSVPLQQLQQLQMLQGLRTEADTDRAGGDVAAELLIPGTVYLIERRGADANATFRLLRDVNRSHLNRILLKRSMLRDQLLSHYVAALDRIRPH